MSAARWVITRRGDVSPALAACLHDDPDALVARGDMLKDGDRSTVARIDLDDGSAYTVKRYNLKGALHTAGHWLVRSRAAWCWINAKCLMSAGLAPAEPVACLEERIGPLRLRSCLVSRFVPGRSLLELVNTGELNNDQLFRLADQFSAIWRSLGRLGMSHGDMKASNFIVDDRLRLWMIDLDGMRRNRLPGLLARQRAKDLARFIRNWQDRPEVAAVFRDRIGTP